MLHTGVSGHSERVSFPPGDLYPATYQVRLLAAVLGNEGLIGVVFRYDSKNFAHFFLDFSKNQKLRMMHRSIAFSLVSFFSVPKNALTITIEVVARIWNIYEQRFAGAHP